MKILTLALLSIAAAAIAATPALADTAGYSFTNDPLQPCFLLCRADTASLNLTTVDPIVQSGNTVTFDGSIVAMADNANPISIVGDSSAVDSPLTLDASDLFSDTPPSLSPGKSYSGPLFTITVPGSAPAGVYNGTFDLIYEDSNMARFTDYAEFQVTVAEPAAVTPEPGCWLLLSTGLAGAGFLRRLSGRAI